MPVAYVETFYDITPPPQNWQGGAYTALNRTPNHKQLAEWANDAITWSRNNLKAALAAEKHPRLYEHKRWRQAKPVTRDNIPPNTPVFKPLRATLAAMRAGEEEGVEEELLIVYENPEN